MSHPSDNHLSAEQLQAFLDGEMPRKGLAAAEEHLASCARCSAEMEAWRTLFEDLGGLSFHRPHQGFEDRVMANVTVPEPRSLPQRLRDQVASALSEHESSHVPGDVLQDFLDGSLAARRAHRIEEHLARCGSCTHEADTWLGLIRRLDGLGTFAPAEGFAEGVMAGVEIPEEVPLAARIRRKIEDILGTSPAPEHVPHGLLQDFADGGLPATVVARVEAHVEECGHCADELAGWQALATRLEGLERLEPAEGFADRVMVGFRQARAAAPTAERAPAWRRALSAARSSAQRLVPDPKQAVAALSGAAVTPMAVLGVVVWALWSHPTLTLGSLISFAWWQASDLAATAFGALSGFVAQNVEVAGLYPLLESAASAPAMVAVGALAYTTICALALRVLYKNLFANRPSGRHFHVSTAS